MKTLVIGSGAREHALAAQLSLTSDVVVAPGNPGMSTVGRVVPVDVADPEAMFALAARESIDVTIVGPELPLERGVADLFRARGRRIVGPSRAAARLETSKVFAKDFMTRHDVPTAHYRVCADVADALAAIRDGGFGFPIVVKADGLAAGKGVVVAEDRSSAEQAVRSMMTDRQFGEAGARVVLEEFMRGAEASFFVLCDGRTALALSSAQDHKRVFDDDRGPNTGGMGAFAPSPLITPDMHARVMREIVEPVLNGLRAEGEEYCGFLYVGLMITSTGPRVVEFNVRFGDPEAQVVIPTIESDFAAVLDASARGRLDGVRVTFSHEPRVGVVLASGGYPGSFERGKPIEGLDAAARLDGVTVFHAGTALKDGRIVTSGGRVLTVVGRGATYADAIGRAYAGVAEISFDGMHYRKDIGRKALART